MQLRARVGLGTAPLGSYPGGPLWWGPQDEATSLDTIVAAIDAGIDWIDTAPFYGWGLAEELVGRALRRRPGALVAVLTKCGTQRAADGRPFEDASPAAVRQDVQASLRRLGLERLDAVQVHDPDPATPVEETVETLEALRERGWVGAIGLSNHGIGLMERAAKVAPLDVVQHQHSLLDRSAEQAGVIAWCAARSIPFLAWSPLASGFLAPGFDLEALDPADLRRRLRWAGAEEAPRLERIRSRLVRVAGRLGCSTATVALAWSTRDPGRHAIVGARTPAEAEALARVPALTGDDVEALDQASAAGARSSPASDR